jgi:hypothetical protein
MQVARPALPAHLALGLSLTHQRVCVVCAFQRSATEPRRDRKRKLFDSPPPPADRSRRRSAITFSARKELVLPPPRYIRVSCVSCGTLTRACLFAERRPGHGSGGGGGRVRR